MRGMDDEPVKPKGPIKSLNSCKSITATSDKIQVRRSMPAPSSSFSLSKLGWMRGRLDGVLRHHHPQRFLVQGKQGVQGPDLQRHW